MSALFIGDDVTVAEPGRLRRTRVTGFTSTNAFTVAFGRSSTVGGYAVADEGITWVKGFHDLEAEPLHSLLAYMATE